MPITRIRNRIASIVIILILMTIGFSSCNSSQSIMPTMTIAALETSTPELPPSSTSLPPTSTSSVTPSTTPTNTPTATQTTTPTSTNTPTNTPTVTVDLSTVENQIYIYFVHLNTGGPVACGDSLVPLSIGHVRTGDVKQDIAIALNTLFSAGQYSGALYNATYTSNLHVDRVEFNKFSGEAVIYTSGSFTKPETNCDRSRYRAQAFTTARQFPEVTRAVIWVGSKLLGDLLVASP